MTKLPPGLRHVLAQTELRTDDREYVIIDVPLEEYREAIELFAELGAVFSTAVIDEDELTLVLPFDVWDEARDDIAAAGEADGYRLITFDLTLELGLVGYLAMLTDVLAEEGIAIFAVSSYQRDHLLVKEMDFERAWAALEEFIASCQQEEEMG